MRSKTKDPDTVWTAVETFMHRDGIITAGTRTRQPIGPEAFWIPNADDADVAATRLALSLERPAPQHYPPPAPSKPKVRCIKTFYDLGMAIEEGALYDADADIVLAVPEAFEPA
jgi:hypothetical protein